MHNFLVLSKESARRKSGRLGMEQVKSPEVNWLKISDVVRGTRLDHKFFLRRPGKNSTGGLK